MAEKRDASSPFIWPPTIYGTVALVSGLLSWLVSWHFEPRDLRSAGIAGGVVLVILGLAVAIMAERRFHAAGTPVPPTRPTTALVFDGIYRRTRNPMYLGMTLGLIGLGLGFDQLWFLIAAPAAMFAVTKLAIEREDSYLERRFGEPYVAYKKKVRRWV